MSRSADGVRVGWPSSVSTIDARRSPVTVLTPRFWYWATGAVSDRQVVGRTSRPTWSRDVTTDCTSAQPGRGRRAQAPSAARCCRCPRPGPAGPAATATRGRGAREPARRGGTTRQATPASPGRARRPAAPGCPAAPAYPTRRLNPPRDLAGVTPLAACRLRLRPAATRPGSGSPPGIQPQPTTRAPATRCCTRRATAPAEPTAARPTTAQRPVRIVLDQRHDSAAIPHRARPGAPPPSPSPARAGVVSTTDRVMPSRCRTTGAEPSRERPTPARPQRCRHHDGGDDQHRPRQQYQPRTWYSKRRVLRRASQTAAPMTQQSDQPRRPTTRAEHAAGAEQPPLGHTRASAAPISSGQAPGCPCRRRPSGRTGFRQPSPRRRAPGPMSRPPAVVRRPADARPPGCG